MRPCRSGRVRHVRCVGPRGPLRRQDLHPGSAHRRRHLSVLHAARPSRLPPAAAQPARAVTRRGRPFRTVLSGRGSHGRFPRPVFVARLPLEEGVCSAGLSPSSWCFLPARLQRAEARTTNNGLRPALPTKKRGAPAARNGPRTIVRSQGRTDPRGAGPRAGNTSESGKRAERYANKVLCVVNRPPRSKDMKRHLPCGHPAARLDAPEPGPDRAKCTYMRRPFLETCYTGGRGRGG